MLVVIVHIRGLCIGCSVGGVTSGTTAHVSKFCLRRRNSQTFLLFAVCDTTITFLSENLRAGAVRKGGMTILFWAASNYRPEDIVEYHFFRMKGD